MMLENVVKFFEMSSMESDDGFGFEDRFIQLEFITGWKRP